MKGAAKTKLYSYSPDCEPISGLPWHLAFGKLRREAIKRRFLTDPHYQKWGLGIDRCWCPQLKKDKELRQLVQSGFLKIRESFTNPNHKQLVLNTEGH